MIYPCPYQSCLDNVRGECFGGGCWRMPEIERECNEEVSSPVENMTFGQAIDACRYRGAKIQRANWNGEGQYVEYKVVEVGYSAALDTAAASRRGCEGNKR